MTPKISVRCHECGHIEEVEAMALLVCKCGYVNRTAWVVGREEYPFTVKGEGVFEAGCGEFGFVEESE